MRLFFCFVRKYCPGVSQYLLFYSSSHHFQKSSIHLISIIGVAIFTHSDNYHVPLGDDQALIVVQSGWEIKTLIQKDFDV